MNNDEIQIINSDELAESFRKLGKICGDCLNSIAKVFVNVWESIKNSCPSLFDIPQKNISRKRFIKLLMSNGIQRNDANKIAKKYHEEQGEYKYIDVFTEWRKNNDK